MIDLWYQWLIITVSLKPLRSSKAVSGFLRCLSVGSSSPLPICSHPPSDTHAHTAETLNSKPVITYDVTCAWHAYLSAVESRLFHLTPDTQQFFRRWNINTHQISVHSVTHAQNITASRNAKRWTCAFISNMISDPKVTVKPFKI